MTGDDKIDMLITRFFSGEVLPEEALELDDWVNRSPENRSYFTQYSIIFEATFDITSNDRNNAWRNIIVAIDREHGDRRSKIINWRLSGIAASVILIISIGLLINKFNKNDPGEIVHKAEAVSKEIVLKDNSEVIVSPHSSISIDKGYGVRNRKITLNGSAMFSVIHNPSLALIVDVNTFHIKDIGTRFSVVTAPMSDTIFISVTDGRISAYDDFGSSENAGAGEKVWYIRSRKKIVVFHLKQDTIIPTPKGNEIVVKTKNPGLVKKIPLPMSPDQGTEDRDSAQHPSYEKDTTQGSNAGRGTDSTQSERIVADLLRDGLIVRGQPLHFILSDTAFILNGKKQGDAIFNRYRDKYGGKPVPAGWSWGHGENVP
jgi:ferric-dicitrate binding protein FerR (iron transport regulator)